MLNKFIFIIIVVFQFSISAWAQSEVKMDFKIKPAGTFQGVTSKVKGFAYKTEDGVAAENVLVDLKSISTGIQLRDDHLRKYLEVDKHPVAKLIKASGRGGKGEATIQIKGSTQTVKGDYKIQGNKLAAKFKMSLDALNIKGVRYMGAGVADDVAVTVVLPLKESLGGKP